MIAWTIKFMRTMYRISRMNTPFEESLDTISSNQSLKDIIGQHFFSKTPVFFALSYSALYNDYIYPQDGVGAFIETMVDAIRKRGGDIRFNTEIVHIFYTPDRQGLGDINTTELQTLLLDGGEPRKDEVYAWLRRFCRYNTFEISIPVLRDPDAAPEGKTGLIISALFDHELTRRIHAAGWYEEFQAARRG
jgi:phytoene dehydrogenase-like protein